MVDKTYIRNRRVRSTIKLAEQFKTDPNKEMRLNHQECVYCFYTIAIAGQAFTRYTCEECGKEDRHHNTNVPKVCMDCAKKMDLCHQCGAEIEMK